MSSKPAQEGKGKHQRTTIRPTPKLEIGCSICGCGLWDRCNCVHESRNINMLQLYSTMKRNKGTLKSSNGINFQKFSCDLLFKSWMISIRL